MEKENKINIAELLKDCPKGMELDCTMFENVTFVRVDNNREQFPIEIAVSGLRSKYLTKEGCFHDATLLPEAKCVIFPKGKTTWEGFVPPCKFKDGDVLAAYECLVLFKELDGLNIKCYCTYHFTNNPSFYVDTLQNKDAFHPATEEEKQKLFQVIKENGYKWNEETKTLEKLPMFKVGDRIKYRSGEIVYRIVQITEDSYVLDNLCSIPISIEHMYNLVPNKFDINTLKPFESRVLVRADNYNLWKPALFGFINSGAFYVLGGNAYRQCIPYESNEHLLNTTDNCDEFYKTWEK